MGKLSRILDSLQEPGLQAVGYLSGMGVQRLYNKLWETDTVNGLLGDETSIDFKRWVTPIATCFTGIVIGRYAGEDSILKPVSDGIAVNGAVTVVKEILFGKSEMAGLSGGVLGGIMGDEDLDDAQEDDDDDDYITPIRPEGQKPALPSRPEGVGRTLPAGRASVPATEESILGIPTNEVLAI